MYLNSWLFPEIFVKLSCVVQNSRETTGKFLADDDQYYDRIQTKGNIFIRERLRPLGTHSDTGTFMINRDTLTLCL